VRHSSPETKRHYLGMVEQLIQKVEKANENIYGKGSVSYAFRPVSQPAAENEQEMTIEKWRARRESNPRPSA
jgi:hypothetical protein